MRENKYHFIFSKGVLPVLDELTEELCGAVAALGMDYYIINPSVPESFTSDAFFSYLSQGGCIGLFFNQIGTLLSLKDGRNLWEAFSVPVYTWVVDHPRNFPSAFLNPVPNLHVICTDRDHAAFVKAYYPKVEKLYFLPCGGSRAETETPYGERDIELLYIGNCENEVG